MWPIARAAGRHLSIPGAAVRGGTREETAVPGSPLCQGLSREELFLPGSPGGKGSSSPSSQRGSGQGGEAGPGALLLAGTLFPAGSRS